MIPVSWSALSFKAETESSFAATQDGRIYSNSFQPTMRPISLQLYAKQVPWLILFKFPLHGWSAFAKEINI